MSSASASSASASASDDDDDELYDDETMIRFAINFLTHCESQKKWVKFAGYSGATCGYTAPGIGLVIKIFRHNLIYDGNTLMKFLHKFNLTMQSFVDIINETIGNFADYIDVCPVTDVLSGTRGLLKKEFERAKPGSTLMVTDEPAKVYKVKAGGSNLVEGANVISFSSRLDECSTFHHATLYTIPEDNICFIIDSWATPIGTPYECRPLTYRQFSFGEVIHALDRLNSNDISSGEATHIFSHYFIAHQNFLQTIQQRIQQLGLFSVFTLRPEYIDEVYNICAMKNTSGKQKSSDFGGKSRKRSRKLRKKTRKLRKRSKKYKK